MTKFLTVDQPTDTLAAPVNADNVRRLADMASSMAKGAA